MTPPNQDGPLVSRRDLLIGLSAGAIGFVVPTVIGGESSDSLPSVADIGFCTDMTTHHVQALVMCQRVLGRETGGAVQAAAAEVLQNQAMEVGQMRAWLTDWDASTKSPETVMAWMATDPDSEMASGVPVAMMPGYATQAELQELSELTGLAQGRRWLELMRAHHVGGVAMAEAAAELASSPKVIRLATAQAQVQTFEISQYDILLEGEYAAG